MKKEIILNETADGDLFFNIPDDVLERLGWKEGDEIKFKERDGGFILTKVRYETIQLDIQEDDLLSYMLFAHEQGISFNELCNQAVEQKLNENNS